MIKTCETCGGMYSDDSSDTANVIYDQHVFLIAQNNRYREALERIAVIYRPANSIADEMQRIAREALGTSQALTDDKRKAVQEHTPPNP